jgi:hypothetical protein
MKTNNQSKQLKQALYDRIEAEKVCPKSKIFFRSRECLVWLVWVISIVLGAFSVAVSLFVVTHGQYSFYEATHENFLTFMVETLPYIWIIAFGLLIIIAIYNLRHTAHGYKYPVWVIISSSLVLSFAGGSAMQFFGLGYKIDNILGKNMDMYMSQDKLERFMWQKPMDGRLVGRQVLSTVSPTSTVIFEDQGGQRWRLNISDLKQEEIERLASEESVRLLGKPVNPEMFIFHACGVFPCDDGQECIIAEPER